MEPGSVPSKNPATFWQTLVSALRDEHHDFTAEPLKRAIILLAVPMVLEMLMEALFAVADVYWVSHLGSDAVSIVGITESLMTIIYSVAVGISMAGTALVARRIGEKQPERASHSAAQVFLLSAIVAVAIGIVLGSRAESILRLMSTPESVIAVGKHFTTWMLGGNITVFLIFVINAAFRGAGNAVVAMKTLILANVINILLGPCLIFGWGPFPELGVTGAAIATNTGRGIGVLYQVWHLVSGRTRLLLRLRHFLPDVREMSAVLKIASTGALQLFINTSSWVGLVSILNHFGKDAVAGYTISVRIVMFALFPAFGIANAGATLAGQNLGAKQPQKAEESVWLAVRYNMVWLGFTGFLFIALAEPLIRVVTADAAMISFGARALWIVGLGFPFYAVGISLSSAFNGAGDTWTPTLLSFAAFWACELPLGWLLAQKLELGPTGVFTAIPVAFTFFASLCFVCFRQGKWKLTAV